MNATTFGFKKNTPLGVIDRAETVINGLQEFSAGINQRILDFEKSYDLFDLSSQLGAKEFRRMLKARFPLFYKDILNQLSVAELYQRLPQFHDKILSLGTSACKELLKATDDLASKILKGSWHTFTQIRKIVSREKKGLSVEPSSEVVFKLAVGTVVKVISKGAKFFGWLAEVTSSPDRFGQLTVRLLKTPKKKPCQLFVEDVEPYNLSCDFPPDTIMTDERWQSVKIQYDLSDSDFLSIKESAYTKAQQSCPPEDPEIIILWYYVDAVLESYDLKPKLSADAVPVVPVDLLLSGTEKVYTLNDLEAAKQQTIAEYQLKWERENYELTEAKRRLMEEVARLEALVRVKDEQLSSIFDVPSPESFIEEDVAPNAPVEMSISEQSESNPPVEEVEPELETKFHQPDLPEQESEIAFAPSNVSEERVEDNAVISIAQGSALVQPGNFLLSSLLKGDEHLSSVWEEEAVVAY